MKLYWETRASWLYLESILPKDGQDFFHLAIDECSQMRDDHLAALRGQLSRMELERSWVLLIDTNAQNSRLASKAPACYLPEGLTMCEPFSNLPMDLGMIGVEGAFRKVCDGTDRKQTHENLKEYLPRWGRPLWAESWLKDCDSRSLRYAGISLEDVSDELSASSMKGTPFKRPESIIAFLTQRLPLTILGFQDELLC